MEKGFPKRLNKIIDDLGMNQSSFAQKTGVSARNISNAVTGFSKPRVDLLINIFKSFPQLNANWLLTGKGNMWLTSEGQGHFEEDQEKYYTDELQRFKQEINALTKEVNYLKEQLKDKERIIQLLEKSGT